MRDRAESRTAPEDHEAGVPSHPPLLEVLDGKRRWGARGEERRRAILEALLRLLEDHELHELSVPDIAAAAEVSRSTFYTYFATREAAVAALMTEMFERMAAFAESMATAPSGAEGVRAGMRRALDYWLDHERLILAMLDARGLDREAAEVWNHCMGQIRVRLTEVLSRQRAAGKAPPGPDPGMVMIVLLSANEGTFERISRGGFTREQQIELGEALITAWLRTLYLTD